MRRACMLFWERDRVLEATVPVLRSRCHGHLVVGGLLRDLDHGVSGDEDLGADSAETQGLACADDDSRRPQIRGGERQMAARA